MHGHEAFPVPFELIEMLMMAASHEGRDFLVDGSMTSVTIDKEGNLRRTRKGAKTEIILIKDIEGIDPAVMTALADYRQLGDRIRRIQHELKGLKTEAKQLKQDAHGRHVNLIYAISDALPVDHHGLFGDDNLRLIRIGQGEGEEATSDIALTTTGDADDGFVFGNPRAEEFLEIQTAIDRDQNLAELMLGQAERYSTEAEMLPVHLSLKENAVDKLFKQHVASRFKDLPDVLNVAAGFDDNGEPVVYIQRSFEEDGNELPPEEVEMFRAIENLSAAHGHHRPLPEPVRKALGLTVPQIESPVAD
ncbi:MAG: hypothetical protein WC544_01975 [Patescibacteria group bacterium]